jgi:hypothetical protein
LSAEYTIRAARGLRPGDYCVQSAVGHESDLRAIVRLVITILPGSGHWHPLAHFAEAVRAAGHDVAFATTPFARQSSRPLRGIRHAVTWSCHGKPTDLPAGQEFGSRRFARSSNSLNSSNCSISLH